MPSPKIRKIEQEQKRKVAKEYGDDTLSEPSKLLDTSTNPSLENFSPVMSSVWLPPIYMSGLLPHPALTLHICKKVESILVVWKTEATTQMLLQGNHRFRLTLKQSLRASYHQLTNTIHTSKYLYRAISYTTCNSFSFTIPGTSSNRHSSRPGKFGLNNLLNQIDISNIFVYDRPHRSS